MNLDYVCNVAHDSGGEPPLVAPTWDFQRNDGALHNAGRNGKFRRRDGRDVGTDGHDDDGRTPGDPGMAPFGKPSAAGAPNIMGDEYENPQEPLVLPRMPLPRRDVSDGGDLKGGGRRTPADLIAAMADNDSEGSEPDGMPVQPWPPELFRKRGRK